jgi:hypothetical protein
MACELALKLLAEQRAGTFKETHDLYYLYDNLPDGPVPFKRTLLKQIPSWGRMAEWRYGGGPSITAIEGFARYRATLQIVAGVADVTKRKIRIGGSRIEIRRAPFLHEDPDMYLPRRKTVAGRDEE